MGNALDKYRNGNKSLSIERQRMNEALARLATGAMFDAIKALGAVAVKLVYYRGPDECRATSWHSDPDILGASMRRLSCEVGYTQIARVLRLALAEGENLS